MSPRIEHTVFEIDGRRLREISRYKQSDMTSENFRDPSKWDDLKDILIYHPDPVVRHEVPFIMQELGAVCSLYAGFLISVLKFDKSIIAKHEAAEALRYVDEHEACRVYRYLTRMTVPDRFDTEVYHLDVQATIQGTLKELERRWEKRALKRPFINYRTK